MAVCARENIDVARLIYFAQLFARDVARKLRQLRLIWASRNSSAIEKCEIGAAEIAPVGLKPKTCVKYRR